MNPIEFEGMNAVFAENQPEYLPLPAYRTKEGEVISCWQLTWKERWKLFLSGKLFIGVLTFNKPLQPVLLSVDNIAMERRIE